MAGILPQLDEKPWTGHFAGYQKRMFRSWVDRNGVCFICPPDGRGGYVFNRAGIRIEPVVEEMKADGAASFRKRLDDGWEALTPAAAPAGKVVYRGTVTGGAKFEVSLEYDGNRIWAGGRLLDTGKLKDPRFTMRMIFPNAYYHERDPEKLGMKARRDRIDFVRVDGKKIRMDVLENVDVSAPEFAGPGARQVRVDLAGYKGARFDLEAAGGSRFGMSNAGGEALVRGFTLDWRADEGADPEGAPRFSVLVR